MGAQHSKKSAFIAGLLEESVFISFRDWHGKRHDIAVRLFRSSSEGVLICSQRWTAVSGTGDRVWINGPTIPLSSLFGLRPSNRFSSSQVNLFKVLVWYFKEELMAWSMKREKERDVSRYPLVMPNHWRFSDGYEGWLTLPTEAGVLEVFRERSIIDGRLAGIGFTLIEAPLHHPLARRLARRSDGVMVLLGLDGGFLPYEQNSLESTLVSLLMGRLVPTGRRNRLTSLTSGDHHV